MLDEPAVPSVRLVAAGQGWRVAEVVCRAGPRDRPFEERHDWVTIAAVMTGTFTYRSGTYRSGTYRSGTYRSGTYRSGTCRSGRNRTMMTPGSFLLGNGGACFECGHEHGSGDRCVAFQFAPETFEDVVRGLRHARSIDFRSVRLPPFGSLLPLFPRIDALLAVRDALFAEDLALAVAAEAVRVDHETDDAPSDARDEARVGKALEAIGTNYRDPLTIAGLAAISGLSVRRFASVFRQVTSETPYRYVLSLRLLAAADRLCRTEEPVLQVALDCGFGDLSEFTRRFHARFGLPPNRYRRLYRR